MVPGYHIISILIGMAGGLLLSAVFIFLRSHRRSAPGLDDTSPINDPDLQDGAASTTDGCDKEAPRFDAL